MRLAIKVRVVIMFVLAVILLAVGAIGLVAPVRCDGKNLESTGSCVVTRDGKPTSITYDEKRSTEQTQSWIVVGLGVLAAGAGFLILRIARRRVAAAGDGTPVKR